MNRSAYKGNLLADSAAASTIADEMDKLEDLLLEAERLGTFDPPSLRQQFIDIFGIGTGGMV